MQPLQNRHNKSNTSYKTEETDPHNNQNFILSVHFFHLEGQQVGKIFGKTPLLGAHYND